MSMATPISNCAKSAKDAGKKPNSGVNRSGHEKVLHEEMYNPMSDTIRKLLLIIRAIPARASNSKFFFKLICLFDCFAADALRPLAGKEVAPCQAD